MRLVRLVLLAPAAPVLVVGGQGDPEAAVGVGHGRQRRSRGADGGHGPRAPAAPAAAASAAASAVGGLVARL